MALPDGENRESVDIDFLVSDLDGYRALRQLLTCEPGVSGIARPGAGPLEQIRAIRADQYGIRTGLRVDGNEIKFEFVLRAQQDAESVATR